MKRGADPGSLVMCAVAAGLLLGTACGDSESGDDDDDDDTTVVDAALRDGGGDAGPDAASGVLAVDAGPDRAVLGGMDVALRYQATGAVVTATWTQEAGPASILADDVARVPADAATGATYRFRITVTDAAGGSAEDEVEVAVKAAVFEDFLADISSTQQLGTSEGIAFSADGASVWIVSQDGFMSRFDADGAFLQRVDLGGQPVGANFDPHDGALVVPDAAGQRVLAIDVTTDPDDPEVTVRASGLTGGGGLGGVNYPLFHGDHLVVSNRLGGRVFIDDGATMAPFAEFFGLNPNAMARGPEPDAIYVGIGTSIMRVPFGDECGACAPEVYVSGYTCGTDVDGLAFDDSGNLFIGCPGPKTLTIVARRPDGAVRTRTFANPGGNIGNFTSLVFGRGAFGEQRLYWTNLTGRTVGRLDVGAAALP